MSTTSAFANARLYLLALVATLLFACGHTPEDGELAAAEITATTAQALSASDVTKVTITITAPDIAAPIVQNLVKTGGQWKGTIGAIPVGSGRRFQGDAYNATNAVVYTGAATNVTITKGATSSVALLLQQLNAPTPFANAAPVIDAFVASSNAVSANDAVALAVTAHDPNPGDPLAYAWSATGGTFTSANTASTSWIAPATDGTYTISVTATDTKSAVAGMSFQVQVAAANGRGAAAVNASFNTWPNVAGLIATPARIDVGQSTALSLDASDNDGDALSFAWLSTCAGAFSGATATPSFTLTALPASGSCTLTATVTDGRGGTNTGSITIATGPGPAANLAPIVDTTFQSDDTAPGDGQVLLRVAAHDPEGTALGFTWSTNAGSLSSQFNNAGSSEITWTAPTLFSVDATITATITDGAGVSTTQSFSVKTGIVANVGGSPQAVRLSPNGTRAYVANYVNDAVDVIDMATGAWIDTIPTLPGPADAKPSPDGSTLYVAYDYEKGIREITRIDIATHAQTGHLSVASSWGSTPLAISRDGSKIYAGRYPFGPITEIDAATFALTGRTFAAQTYDAYLEVSPDGNSLWVGNLNVNYVRVIDIATDTSSTIGVPSNSPVTVFSADGTHAYVRSGTAGTPYVTDITLADGTVVSTPFAGNGEGTIALGGIGGNRLVVTDGSSAFFLDTLTKSTLSTTSLSGAYGVAAGTSNACIGSGAGGLVKLVPLP